MLFVVYVVIYIVPCCDATRRTTVLDYYRHTFVGAVWLLSLYVFCCSFAVSAAVVLCVCCQMSLTLGVVHTSTRVTSRGPRRQREPKSATSTLPWTLFVVLVLVTVPQHLCMHPHHRLHTPSLYCSWTFSALTLIFLCSILMLSTHT